MSTPEKVKERVDTMWKCENDILKDLATLNDFGDAKPYEILYSNGRGTKIKQKQKSPEKFMDPRTGEVLDLSESEFSYSDDLSKGKGRGRHFGNFSKKQFRLREQLRLARPLGSGDEAIESFCRRFRDESNTIDKTTASDSETNTQTGKNHPGISKPTDRVKGIRNSALQSNALINSILSKTKNDSNAELLTDQKNATTDAEDNNSIFSDKDFPSLPVRSTKATRTRSAHTET